MSERIPPDLSDLTPEERLLAAVLRLAIRDALYARDENTREQAAGFVWAVAPSVAARSGLPETIAADNKLWIR